MTLEAVARLLGPADGARVTVVDAGTHWATLPRGDGPSVWGRAPAPSGTPVGAALAHAARREMALKRVKGSVTRWRPPDLGAPPARNVARHALLSGAIVEVDRPPERVLDAMAAEAGGRVESFRPGSGGAVLARIEVEGRPALLRAGISGNEAAALTSLDHPAVPRLIASGDGWTAETVRPGSRPRRVTPEGWRACVDLCAGFPRTAAPEAPRSDMDAIDRMVPDVGAREALEPLEALGGIARHGDLWRPNLLTKAGSLTGVVDWDAWHPAAAPGTDLLNLYASERHGPRIGAAWAERPWRSEGFAEATRAYWDALELSPTAEQLDAVAVAWWAGQVAASLRRLPHRAHDGAWLEANVFRVVGSL